MIASRVSPRGMVIGAAMLLAFTLGLGIAARSTPEVHTAEVVISCPAIPARAFTPAERASLERTARELRAKLGALEPEPVLDDRLEIGTHGSEVDK